MNFSMLCHDKVIDLKKGNRLVNTGLYVIFMYMPGRFFSPELGKNNSILDKWKKI